MIELEAFLGGHDFFKLPENIQQNLTELHFRINSLQKLTGKQFVITSAYRSWEDHVRIYREKGFADKDIPKTSKHLIGAAADIEDKDGSLALLCKQNNDKLIVDGELWCEDTKWTKGWIHAQIFAPGSGNRWFIPF